MQISFEYEKLKRAIQRSPQIVAQETKDFLSRANSRLTQKINQQPWRVGSGGGGVPIWRGGGKRLGGNLKKAHDSKFEPFKLTISVDKSKTKMKKWNYAELVHDGTRKMKARPWLRYAEDKATPQINQDAKRLLENVVRELGR